MSTEEIEKKRISRREFVKGAAFSAAGLVAAGVLTGCTEATTETVQAPAETTNDVKPWLPDKWDKETEVLVMGYGGAGACAAISAAKEGAKVLVIEKSPEIGMSSTFACSGSVRLPGTPYGPNPDWTQEDFIKDFYEGGNGGISLETVQEMTPAWFEAADWLSELGYPWLDADAAEELGINRAYTDLGPDWISIWSGKKVDGRVGTGREHWAFLNNTCKDLGVEVLVNTPGKRLIQDPFTKEILGVVAESEGKEIYIKAKKAVIMTCGSFSSGGGGVGLAREFFINYISECPAPIYPGGSPYNAGEGIKMAMAIGADLWHMRAIEWARDGMRPPEFPAAFWLDFKAWSLMVVNKAGKRFKDESVTYGHAKKYLEVLEVVSGGFPNTPSYYIFDEKTRTAGKIIMLARGPGRSSYSTYNCARELYTVPEWSEDNSAEIAKGWILKADTLAELATKTGIDPAGLEEEVAKYNEYCANGADLELFRPPNRLVPIDQPPYYSVECVLNTINTQGGPKRNAKTQVLDTLGNPIPRLYSGGEFGSWHGQLYQYSNLGENIVTGMVSGRNAAALTAWDEA
jgi:succinate dehydrogenase/fumarate reductase flavoprotein subunit